MLKRTFDVVFSTFGLLIVWPILAAIALMIKAHDRGPVFYRGVRVGRNRKPFRIFKFRTMVVDADRIGGPSTADDDARITAAGRFLRRYKLDELPQLINVIKGEMSFVGPRPEVAHEVETYSDTELRVLSVRPGITDWASLTFHNEGEILKGSPDPHLAYREKIRPEKLRLALKYVDENTLRTDIKIIIRTLATLMNTRKRSAGT